MNTRTAAIGVIVLLTALLAFMLWRRTETLEPSEASEPRASQESSIEEPSPSRPVPATPEPVPRVAKPSPPEAPTPRPGEVVMPLDAKLVPESLSEVPHEVVGAWDDRPDSTRLGSHRTFVAVVDPSISNSELEALLRDILQRQRDAVVLDVRVYDSAEAARRPSYLDGGELRESHLVAEIKRNDRLAYESIEVRGVAVGR